MTLEDLLTMRSGFQCCGESIVRQMVASPDWTQFALDLQMAAEPGTGSYGYQWWLDPSSSYYACGVGGQEIWVLTDQDMVVVMNGATGGGHTGAWREWLLRSHIIPLAELTAPLPPNPDAVAALASEIQSAAAPLQVQPDPVPPMPEIAQREAGISYVLDENPLGLLSFTLSFPANDEAPVKVTTLGSGAEAEPQFDWLIGLEYVELKASRRYGMLTSAKGLWKSDTVNVAQIDDIANRGPKFRVSMVLEGDQVTMEQWGAGKLEGTLIGRVEE